MPKYESFEKCPICRTPGLTPYFSYSAPPRGETRFDFFQSQVYFREYRQCDLCHHLSGYIEADLSQLYEGAYTDATYDRNGLSSTFHKIIQLPPERSDNTHRIARILAFLGRASVGTSSNGISPQSVLDIGSGTGVFAHGMKQHGWTCTVIDPDPRAAAHAREVIGVKAVCGDFLKMPQTGKFDLITFNKVLEHVTDPVEMLQKSTGMLRQKGTVYIEVPDCEAAAEQGPTREEFFIEHLHVFSLTSLSLLAAHAGYRTVLIERLREPSGKYTLYAFLTHLKKSPKRPFK